MDVRILDLDGSLAAQMTLADRYQPRLVEQRSWGPRLRLGCRWGVFNRYVNSLNDALAFADTDEPQVTLYGSGDFHHVSLALLCEQTQPVNLLVLDHHPDWMRGVPFLHCGTWLYHAARLPHVRHIFHVGGDLDFDNRYRWLAPWSLLEDGKITVFPALRSYRRGRWQTIAHEPVRPQPHLLAGRSRLSGLIEPFADELARFPLYISLDKDVLCPGEAPTNWEPGHLTLGEVEAILETFLAAGGNRLAGMDIVGDWSPVETRGLLRRLLHWSEHPRQDVDPVQAAEQNEITNLALLEAVRTQTESAPVHDHSSPHAPRSRSRT